VSGGGGGWGSRGSSKSEVKIFHLILGPISSSRPDPRSKFWDPITPEPLMALSKPYRVYTRKTLQETDLFNGEGLELIRVRVLEIPNYTVKMGVSTCVGQYG